ncbi:MAG: aldo/keto reductase [Gammaproteobacteria bacterium]|nr:aldo/keto reductase [Gammaproteobacteria bacterium]
MSAKIALGSVQFGLDYGISNQGGKTSQAEIVNILTYAKQQGIDTLDTAEGYGDSEIRLGECGVDAWQVVSKWTLRPDTSPAAQLAATLQRLQIKQLYGYLLNQPLMLLQRPEIWPQLQVLQAEGHCRRIGFTLYRPEELQQLLDAGFTPDLVQLPYSSVDQRFATLLPQLQAAGVEIHSRSVFLQGLLLMSPQQLSDHFAAIKPYLTALEQNFSTLGERIAALLQTVITHPAVSRVIIGVNSQQQLQENLAGLAQTAALLPPAPQLADSILLPSLWPKS